MISDYSWLHGAGMGLLDDVSVCLYAAGQGWAGTQILLRVSVCSIYAQRIVGLHMGWGLLVEYAEEDIPPHISQSGAFFKIQRLILPELKVAWDCYFSPNIFQLGRVIFLRGHPLHI